MSSDPALSTAAAAELPRGPAESPATLAGAWETFFDYWSPRWMAIFASFFVGLRLALGAYSTWDLAIIAAVLVSWPLQEWLIHVFILHFEPKRIGRFTIDLRVAKKHREHHRDPWRLDNLFIPTHIHPFAVPAQLLFWWLVTPTLPLAITGVAIYFVLSLHYEWVHYLVHVRYRPRSRWYGRLWRNHRLHHFMNEHYWFGVSMLSGDHLLRTAPDRGEVEPSPTCRTLGRTADLE
ncbi:MAG: sterol desaturase family protein [Deltaproteobacteria bacterium]|nr:sterol desaturase family protein [Deltaproteobacteria bacterium]